MLEINKFIKTKYEKHRKLILYFIIGIVSASVDVLIFAILFNLVFPNLFGFQGGEGKNFANMISYTLATVNSFIFNRKYNFKLTDNTLKRFISFMLVGLIGYLVSTLCFFIFVDLFGFNKRYEVTIIKVFSIIFVFITQYNLNKLISFREKKI